MCPPILPQCQFFSRLPLCKRILPPCPSFVPQPSAIPSILPPPFFSTLLSIPTSYLPVNQNFPMLLRHYYCPPHLPPQLMQRHPGYYSPSSLSLSFLLLLRPPSFSLIPLISILSPPYSPLLAHPFSPPTPFSSHPFLLPSIDPPPPSSPPFSAPPSCLLLRPSSYLRPPPFFHL